MKKILGVFIALVFGISQIAYASTNVPAKDVTVDTSSFSNNLNSSDKDVQLALNTLDQVLGGLSSINWGDIHGTLSNQTDLQNALNSKISGISWGQITGTLSNQSDLNTALSGKVATSTTVNGHALTGNVVVSKSDVGLGNVQNVDTTNASNITSGIISNALLSAIPNTDINWNSLNANVQGFGINWASILNAQLQSGGINWSSLNKVIQTSGVNWASLLNSEIQYTGINWNSLNKTIQALGINWTSVNAQQLQSTGINWISLNQSIQANGINWTSLIKNIQTTGINWQSVINSEIQEQGINWISLNQVITEGAFNFSNITTGNATTSAHGLSPILPNNANVYYNGIGTFTSPPGSGTINSSTIGYYGQYSGSTTISGIQFIQAGGINWNSLNASQIQNLGINWSSLNNNIQALGVNWTNLNKNIQSTGINWTSLIQSVQATGINWTSLVQSVQATGINWTSLVNNVQGTGINWASIVALIQTGNINWPSVKNMEIQSAGINWASVIAVIQASAVNWPSVNLAQIQGAGVNWTSVGNITTSGTITSNGFNTNSNVAGAIKLYELPTNGNTYVSLQSPNTVNTSVTWTLPAADGVGCFQSNGSGTVSIGTCGGGSGTVNSGTQYQLGYYSTTGSTISGNSNITTDASNDLTVGGSIISGGTGQSTIGYGLAVNSNGATSINGGDFTFKNSIGSTIFSIGATSGNLTIPVTGTIQCLQAGTTGIVTGTGSACGASGGGSPGGSTGNIQYNNGGSFGGLSQLASSYLNWNNINGLTPINFGGVNWNDLNLHSSINTGAMNWASINSLALHNASGINWNSLLNQQIQYQGINWGSVINKQIQNIGVNWSSLNQNINSAGLNWTDLNGNATINSSIFASVTGSGNIVVLSNSPTITAPELIANVGIGSAYPSQALDVKGTVRMTGLVMTNTPINGYVLTTDGNGNGTWQPSSTGSGTVNSGNIGQVAYYGSTGTAVSTNANINLIGTNVGIGTSTASKLLAIGSTGQTTFDTGGTELVTTGNVAIGTKTASNYLTVGSTGGFQVSSSGSISQIGADTLANLSSGALSLDGGAGVATVADKSTTAGGTLGLYGGNSTTGELYLSSNASGGSTDSIQFAVSAGSTIPMVIQDNSGTANIGIGSITPNATLDVEGTINPTVFNAIPNALNVGIGSFIPGEKLDVQGTIRSSLGIIAGGIAPTNFGSNVGIGSVNPQANLVLVGHMHSHGIAPTAGTCGTSPSFGSLATDFNGSVTVGLGASTTSCTVNFNLSWLHAPNCIVQDDSNPLVVAVSTTTSAMTITSLTTMSTVSVGDKLTWICTGVE